MTDPNRERVEAELKRLIADAELAGEPIPTKDVAVYRSILEGLFGPALEQAPADWSRQALDRALAMENPSPQAKRSFVEKAREWTADAFVRAARVLEGTLVLDSMGGAVAGTRSQAAELGPQSILYDFEPGRLILQLSREGEVRRVDGQFIAHVDRAESTRQAKVIQHGHVETVEIADTGRFTFADLNVGFARVEVLWGDTRMGIDPIEM